jgi:anaerobic ribonucleoside-triphosphate reductase activating protein
MSAPIIRVAGVVAESITDGPGLRYALFVQGCSLRCDGCQNPGTHDPSGGEARTADAIWADIVRNPMLRGVTFSGGEPFDQAAALLPLAEKIRAGGLELAAYSGYTFEQLMTRPEGLALLRQCQVLVDGPFVLARRSLNLRFRGSGNQRILDVPASLAAGEAVERHDGRWQD